MGHEREPILVGPQGKESRSAGMESKDSAAPAGITQRAVCSNRANRTVLQEGRVASILLLRFWQFWLGRLADRGGGRVGWIFLCLTQQALFVSKFGAAVQITDMTFEAYSSKKEFAARFHGAIKPIAIPREE